MTSSKTSHFKLSIWLFALLFVCAVPILGKSAIDHKHVCETDKNKLFDGNKCYVLGTSKTYWHMAKRACRTLPRLPGFGPPALLKMEMNKGDMAKLVNGLLRKAGEDCEPIFVGAELMEFPSKWRWVSDQEAVDETNWADGQPDTKSERCSAIYTCHASTSIGLHDYYCKKGNFERQYICQYEQNACLKPTLPANLTIAGFDPISANRKVDEVISFREGTTVMARCKDGHTVIYNKTMKTQPMTCKEGNWTMKTKLKKCVTDEVQRFLEELREKNDKKGSTGNVTLTILGICAAASGVICIICLTAFGFFAINILRKNPLDAKTRLETMRMKKGMEKAQNDATYVNQRY